MTAATSSSKKPRKSKPTPVIDTAATSADRIFQPGTFVTTRLEGIDFKGNRPRTGSEYYEIFTHLRRILAPEEATR